MLSINLLLTDEIINCFMASASEVLFGKLYNGRFLFKRQFDLVQDFLNTPESSYYIEKTETEKYEKEATRLKTLVSQLLSTTVNRNIPPEFPNSLRAIVQKKIESSELADQIVKEVVAGVKLKNESNRSNSKQLPTFDRLKADFNSANYIAIITANPLEIELDTSKDMFSLRKLFVDDFLKYISNPDSIVKKYRLLLPLESTCQLFWKGLKNIVFTFIKENKYDDNLMKFLGERYSSQYNQLDLFINDLPIDEYIERLTSSLITSLNNEGNIVVFSHTTPLFNLPTIALNPADSRRSKVYSLLDTEREEAYVHTYSINETVLWRLFVWDRIKTKQYSGKRIDFITAMNDVADI